jgi:ketosteroid isomerase-like protein
MTRRIAAVALLALAACAPKPETPEQMAARMKVESDSAKIEIEAALAHIAQQFVAGNVDSVVMAYTEDAVVMEPNAPPVRGRAAIKALFAEALSWGKNELSTAVTRVDANGPLAVAQGTYFENLTPGPHAPPGIAASYPDTAKFVSAWKKVNGVWLIFADDASSNRAIPAPTARKH